MYVHRFPRQPANICLFVTVYSQIDPIVPCHDLMIEFQGNRGQSSFLRNLLSFSYISERCSSTCGKELNKNSFKVIHTYGPVAGLLPDFKAVH